MGGLKDGLKFFFVTPIDHQDPGERRQSTVSGAEEGRRQEAVWQNQEVRNFLRKEIVDINLPEVTVDGDKNFLEKNFQIQIQRNKEE